MSKAISINNFLCDIESGEIKIEWFNTNSIKVMKLVSVTNETKEIVSGDLEEVYDFIYREEWGDYDVVKVVVQEGSQTQIIIDFECDSPVLEKIIPIKGA